MRKSVYIFLMAFTLFLCSCNNLSRSEAEKVIREQTPFPFKQVSQFKLTNRDESNMWAVPQYLELEKQGIVNLVKWNDHYHLLGADHIRSTPTAIGKHYLADTADINSDCILSWYEFGAITGVSQENNSTTAVVKYTARYFATPLASILIIGNTPPPNGTVYEYSVTLTKFDDGWRLNKEEGRR